MFAYEACVISKERLFPTDVFRKFGWDEDEAREFSNNAGFASEFQRLLFSRVVPNLSRIGLLTDKVRPLYDKLGVLEFESHDHRHSYKSQPQPTSQPASRHCNFEASRHASRCRGTSRYMYRHMYWCTAAPTPAHPTYSRVPPGAAVLVLVTIRACRRCALTLQERIVSDLNYFK